MPPRNTAMLNEHLDSRVGRLEGTMENLAAEVKATSESVRDISRSMGGFKEEILSRLGTIAAPRWPLIVSVGTLLLTIICLGGTIIALLMSGQRDAIETLKVQNQVVQSNLYNDRYETGRSSVIRDELKSDISDLNTTIADLKHWRLAHEVEDTEFRGKILARQEMVIKEVDRFHTQIDDNIKNIETVTAKQNSAIILLDETNKRQYDDRMSRLNRLENKETK
jgi:hypothetical protein